MDTRLKSLIEILEKSEPRQMCKGMTCFGVQCSQCPLESPEALEEVTSLLKTYEVLEK